ncbi:hypothetical protein T09_503 [Trichinella sp. T9]|nr:hypothetical protein T09_503 [Trichinella sp. T9]KRZ84969.1 hypothetical protein T08_3545 [Trichinella sp. T8]
MQLKRLASEDPRPARNTMYYSRAQKYPRLLARRQDLRFWPSTGESLLGKQ